MHEKLENENLPESVPYIVYEGELARQERNAGRWFIVCIIFIVLFVATNAFWIFRETKFATEVITSTETITQDSGEGGTNTFAGDFYGGDYNGKTDDYKNDNGGTKSEQGGK